MTGLSSSFISLIIGCNSGRELLYVFSVQANMENKK